MVLRTVCSWKGGVNLDQNIPEDWLKVLGEELKKPYFTKLKDFVAKERAEGTVFPEEANVFSALKATPYEKVRAVVLGQDPYHDMGQAHGLCFSVLPGVKPPPSLANIYKELKNDLGIDVPRHGYLQHWAEQGILMLNAVLTVRAHEANSHKDEGWEQFTDEVIRKVNEKSEPVIFVLWGGYAGKKAYLVDSSKHVVMKSAHPSPLSARNGFFGSKPFSKINEQLKEFSSPEIDWHLPLERVDSEV